MNWILTLVIASELFSLISGSCDPICPPGYTCYDTECIELPKLSTSPMVRRYTCGVLSVSWRGWTHGKDTGDSRISHYKLQKSTEADPDRWEAFSRYNHYHEGGLLEETFRIPEGSSRQRFRVDVYLAINNSIVDSFTPGPPSAFYSADCPDCPEGLYGDNCSASCNCVSNTTCHSSNGACRYGCNYGYSGLSCNIALPTLPLPPVVHSGEECGTVVVTWIPGNYTDLDTRIKVHSYQINTLEVNKKLWSTNDELIHHRDSLSQFVANITGLRTGHQYRFRVNIRVSEYGEILAEFTLGPASNTVNIQCRNQTESTLTSSLEGTVSTLTPSTSSETTWTESNTEQTWPSSTTTAIMKTTSTTATTTSAPAIIETTATSTTIADTTSMMTATALTTSATSSIAETTTTSPTPSATFRKHTTTAADDNELSNEELDLMISDLSVTIDDVTLKITWRLEERYTYLMRSGSLYFGMVGVGHCNVNRVIDWNVYPLTLDVREFRISHWNDWRLYRIRIEYHQHTPDAYTPSKTLDYATPKHVPFSSVKDVTVSSLTSSSVQVSWKAPMCSNLGSDIISYTCALRTSEDLNVIRLQTESEMVQVDTLKPFTNYSVVIAIENDIGPGPSSSPVIFHTLEDIPGPPTIIKLSPLQKAILVIFTPPMETNGVITKYRLMIEEAMTSLQTDMESDVTSVTIKNLSSYTKYNIKVQARTSVGWGGFSTVRVVMTLEDTPGRPTEFTVTFQNETTIGIRWKSPNFTRGVIQGCKVSYRQRGGSHEKSLFYGYHSAIIEVKIPGLAPGEYYHFRVMGRSGAGYGPSLNGSSFTFPATPPKPPMPEINYENKELKLTLNPNIRTEKHFYLVRIYVHDVSSLDAKNLMEETGLTGTVILMLDEDDIAQSVTYRLGDNSTRHGVQNTALELNHTYIFYLEVVIYFENIIRSNYVKYPDSFTIDSHKQTVRENVNDEESGIVGVVVGVILVILLIPAAATICIVMKRSKTKGNTRSDYDGNETTYDWEKAVNLGGSHTSNFLLSTSLRRSLDSINGSLLGNTSLLDEPRETKTITRSSSFQVNTGSSQLENQHSRSKCRRSIKKSLSDTDMFQKNSLYRENDDNPNVNSYSSRIRKVPNDQNEKTSSRKSSVNKAQTLPNETKKKAPPKPKRHRLHRSATGSNIEELKRRACSPIAEEDFDEMMKSIDELSNQHKKMLYSKPRLEVRTDTKRNIYSNNMDSFNANAMDIGTQTSAERDTAAKSKLRRKRKILASSAMSETRRYPRNDQRRKQTNKNEHIVADIDQTENNGDSENKSEKIICSDNDHKRQLRIRRKRALQRRAESMKGYKDDQLDSKSKSMSFNYGDSRRYIDFIISSSSDDEIEGIKSRIKSQNIRVSKPSNLHQNESDSLNVDKQLDFRARVSAGTNFDRRNKKSHSLRETGSTMHGEYREQDILKFWSKTYSFLDERKIVASPGNVEDYKVTTFYESDRPQTVSLELEFKSLPTGVLGTTNIARQKAGVPAHKLCLESYDHSRVILIPEGPDDYINASYIKDRTRGGAPRYIAARTPTDAQSALKFWRMVLQEGSKVIVKLSQQEDIFPTEITRHSEQVTERFQLTHCEDLYIHKCAVRYMRLKNVLDHSSRGVYIVHNLQWPDDDRYYLPQDTNDFISMREVVRKCQGISVAPVIVHCGQEDGRSGIFIAVDALLLEYEKHREVNIFSFVRNMLKDRYGMVKTIWQYRFIYEALLESHLLS